MWITPMPVCVCTPMQWFDWYTRAHALTNTHIRTQEGNSCLHIAAAQGSNGILRILLDAGAEVTGENKVDR